MEPSVWLIAGPTASGKSALALTLAEALGGEVVNADSMQLYAELRVLTARPSPADAARAPHHLYGVGNANEAWSVGRWLQAAKDVLAEISARARPAIVVGGTGLYFRALTEGLAEIPPVGVQARAAADARYAALGEPTFRDALAERDPLAAARIQPGDRQRLVRAWSVAEATGVALSAWQASDPPVLERGRYEAVVLEPPRPWLYARCDARLKAMANGDALEEVAALLRQAPPPNAPLMKALGVREFADVLAGRCSLDKAVAAAQMQTRRYAKRQSTWFRNQAPHWPRITATEPEAQWMTLQSRVGASAA